MNSKKIQSKTYPSILTFIFIIILSPAFISDASAEEVYKWTDEQGITHYSDIKPNDKPSQSMKVSGGKATRSVTSTQERIKKLDAKQKSAQQKLSQEQQQETKQKLTQSTCQSIRDNLNTLEEKNRIRINENGQWRYLSPEEIAEKKAEYQSILAEQC